MKGNNIFEFFKWKDVFSLLCAVFGFFAIIVAVFGNFSLAAAFLVLAGIFDYADGFIARKFSAPTEYGAYIDTVADVVAFGVAPATFIFFYALTFIEPYFIVIDPLYSVFYMTISVIVMCAGLMRLARYLCLENEKKNENKEYKSEANKHLNKSEANKYPNVYVGIPITFNALIIPLLYILSQYLNFNLFFLTLISAYLMISTIEFKKI